MLIPSHSGGQHINPTLQDSVFLPDNFAGHINHVGSSRDTHSIIQSGLVPGGKDVKKGRHAVFFTAVNPMFIDHYRETYILRRNTAQKCSVQQQLESTSKFSKNGVV